MAVSIILCYCLFEPSFRPRCDWEGIPYPPVVFPDPPVVVNPKVLVRIRLCGGDVAREGRILGFKEFQPDPVGFGVGLARKGDKHLLHLVDVIRGDVIEVVYDRVVGYYLGGVVDGGEVYCYSPPLRRIHVAQGVVCIDTEVELRLVCLPYHVVEA